LAGCDSAGPFGSNRRRVEPRHQAGARVAVQRVNASNAALDPLDVVRLLGARQNIAATLGDVFASN